MSSFTLREAMVLDGSGGFTGPLDVEVRDGRVVTVGTNLTTDAPSVDFSGLWLLPGIFDCHDHVAFSTVDMLEAGVRSIEHGGFLTEEQAALMAKRDCLRWARRGR